MYKEAKVNEQTKPAVRLVGQDGNAFAILGRCKRAAQRAGWAPEDVETFMAEAMNGDYDHLLRTVMERFEVA